jgi:hypothetical protein
LGLFHLVNLVHLWLPVLLLVHQDPLLLVLLDFLFLLVNPLVLLVLLYLRLLGLLDYL